MRALWGLFRAAVPLCLGAPLFLACHHVDPNQTSGVAAQYDDAMKLVRHGHWGDAQTALQRLQFDLSARDTLQARVRFYLAESYAGQDEWLTATREFRRVSDDYPNDPLAPVALMRAADCYAELWKDPQLDPSNGQTALATYQELIGRYPDSQAAHMAQTRVQSLQNKFARKDYETGLFYFKRGAYDSAILYFRGLIVQYPSAASVPDAYTRLAEAYQAINYREELSDVCDHLRQQWSNRRDVRKVCGDRSPGR